MPKNQNFCFSTGVRHPAPNYHTPKILPTYRGLAVTRAVAVSFDDDSSLLDAVGTGINGADFDKSAEINQGNIFVEEAIASTQFPKSQSSLSLTALRLIELLTLLPYCRFNSRLLDRALIASQEGRLV